MTKYVCTVCGYIAEGSIPEFCPVCKAPASKFIEKKDNTYVTEHVVGIAKDVPEEIKQGLRENFNGECSEVGMYLAMSRVADREGYPEIAEAWKRYAFEAAAHASKFPVSPSCWARSSPTAPRRTCRCALTPSAVPAPARWIWPRRPRS